MVSLFVLHFHFTQRDRVEGGRGSGHFGHFLPALSAYLLVLLCFAISLLAFLMPLVWRGQAGLAAVQKG